jgi:hypothetical protein
MDTINDLPGLMYLLLAYASVLGLGCLLAKADPRGRRR